MNHWSFWAWYGPVLAGLLAIGVITGAGLDWLRGLVSEWKIARGHRAFVKEQAAMEASEHRAWLGEGVGEPVRRRQLENAATGQDKAWRRLH